jgi:hypothetical protein
MTVMIMVDFVQHYSQTTNTVLLCLNGTQENFMQHNLRLIKASLLTEEISMYISILWRQWFGFGGKATTYF